MIPFLRICSELVPVLCMKIFNKQFSEVRHFASKQVAFIEFDNDVNASNALVRLNDALITPDCTLHITFAKK